MANKTDEEIIDLAYKRFEEIESYERTVRQQMKDDKRFYLVDQWDPTSRRSREVKGFERPVLTVPRINQFIEYVSNQQRQNKPGIKITPIDDGAQEKYAKNRQGVAKHIQNHSKANLAHQKMFDDMLQTGRGHAVVNTEYISERSFEQDIMVDSVNALDVYMDIHRKRPDYSDCKWGFILERIPRDEYKEVYPDKPVKEWRAGKDEHHWVKQDSIVLAQYWVLEEEEDELLKIRKETESGEVIVNKYRSELKEELGKDAKKENILQKRDVMRPVWRWYKMNSEHILKRQDLVCKEIPIITCIGEEDSVEGELTIKGMVRKLKDSARMYNFYASQEAEVIGQSPKTKWIGAVGQFEGLENKWAQANNTPIPFLEYHPTSSGGGLVPPPSMVQPPTVPVAYVQAKADIIEDMKAISGLQTANFGGRTNESSGVAIRERKAEGDNSNFHYVDNYSSALSHEGRVINQMMNTYYPTDRVVSVMGEEDEVLTKRLGEMEKGEEFSLGEGEFDVVVEVGPSFATQRQAAASNMIDTARFVPAIGQSAGDKIVRAMDWPMKDSIADRVKEFIRISVPGMNLEDKDEADQAAIQENLNQQLQSQLQQSQAQIQQLQQTLQQIDQAKMQMDQAKIQDDTKRTQLEELKIQTNTELERQKLALESEKLKVEAMKVDTQEDTKIEVAKINQSSTNESLLIQGELSKREKEADGINEKDKAKLNESLEEMKKQIEDNSKPKAKSTVVTKGEDGKFKATTTDEDGNKIVTNIEKKGKGYVLESK